MTTADICLYRVSHPHFCEKECPIATGALSAWWIFCVLFTKVVKPSQHYIKKAIRTKNAKSPPLVRSSIYVSSITSTMHDGMYLGSTQLFTMHCGIQWVLYIYNKKWFGNSQSVWISESRPLSRYFRWTLLKWSPFHQLLPPLLRTAEAQINLQLGFCSPLWPRLLLACETVWPDSQSPASPNFYHGSQQRHVGLHDFVFWPDILCEF